ncbi:MAG: tryptophan 2,3-dioxygenase family protein [Microscillaceae bacterium]|nr:tryptophan 2,3-dioxygenase family protein [Microscillaceae bacterium]
MEKEQLSPEIIQKLKDLEEKYSLTGQDLLSNLEGLQYANYLKYWEYIHLETLLSLQNPRTDFPDEKIFIVYHQITELYLNLILWEIDQIANNDHLTSTFFLQRIKRINRYFENLSHSFDLMTEGMDKEQFRKFRMALLPASGFQSAQFRMVEFCSTDFINLLEKKFQNPLTQKADVEEVFSYLYWLQGANDSETGQETITSKHFQEKYREKFIELANTFRKKNLWQRYLDLTPDTNTLEIKKALREYDQLINVDWRLAHYRSAVRYLKNKETTIEATGGTNWQKYLPPRFQKTIFFPLLWSEEEKRNWGKNWVDNFIE